MNDNQGGTGRELVSDPQKAELTDIINKMKQGNPPATEGEIAKVIEDYKARDTTAEEEVVDTEESKPTDPAKDTPSAAGFDSLGDWAAASYDTTTESLKGYGVKGKNTLRNAWIGAKNAGLSTVISAVDALGGQYGVGRSDMDFVLGEKSSSVLTDTETGEEIPMYLPELAKEDRGGWETYNPRYQEIMGDSNMRLNPIAAPDRGAMRERYKELYTEGEFKGLELGAATNSFMGDKFDEIEQNNLEMGDTGSGIVGGFKEGDYGDVILGAVNGLVSVVSTMVPAVLTRGVSLIPQVVAPMYTDYNRAKAEAIYGEDDPEAMDKLIQNDETELAIPTALGLVAVALEKVGIRGIGRHIAAKSFTGRGAAQLVMTGGKEGLTEWLQGGVEQVNTGIAKGDDEEKILEDTWEWMKSDDALESFAQGFVGGGGMAAGGRIIRRAVKDDTQGLRTNEFINALGELQQRRSATNSPEVKKSLDKKIKELEQNFKIYINENNGLAEYLTEDQSKELVDVLGEKTSIRNDISKLEKQKRKNNISEEDFDLAKGDAVLELEKLQAKANQIKRDANRKLLQENLKTSDQAIGKVEGLTQTSFDTTQEFLDEINRRLKEKGKPSISDASNIDGLIFDNEILINEEVAAETNAISVGSHELLHGIMKSTLNGEQRVVGKDANGQDVTSDLTEDGSKLIKSFLETLSSKELSVVEQRISDNYKYNKDGSEKQFEEYAEEYLNSYADAAVKGEFNDGMLRKVGNFIANIFKGKGYDKIKFESGEDVKSFLKDYVKDVKKGKVGKKFTDLASEGIEVDTSDLKLSMTPDQKKAAAKNVKELGTSHTNKSWRRGGADAAIKNIKDNGYFDALIASKYKVKPVPRDFVEKVYSEITPHIKRFKPEQNDDLFAYINSQIGNKAGNVYNSEYKVDEAMRGSKDIDAKTSEGAPVIQVEAETDAGVQAFEEQDMSMAAQAKRTKLAEQGKSESDKYSGLRTELGLEKPMMDKVRKAVMKTFGTKLPDVNSKKFKAALQKAYRTELKKPIQDMIGKGATYDTFLTESFPTVFKFLPKETLLQMERNVAPENRIFTKSERITKPTEVDKLVSDGLLPKDTNRLSGPTLITKLPYPGSKKVKAYFRGQNMEDVLGYKVGASTLGTRKDKLAMEMGVELGFDATMETVQDPEVAARREGILELTGQVQAENDISVMGKQIDRDPGVKFSKSSLFEAQAMSLVKDVVNNGFETVFTEDGKLVEGYPAFGYSQKAIDFAYNLWDDGTLNDGKSIGFKAKVFLSDKFPQEVKDAFKEDGTLKNNDDALDRLYDAVSVLTTELGPGVMDAIGFEIAGFKNRIMNPPGRTVDRLETVRQGKTVYAKDENGNIVPGQFFERLQKLSEKVRKSTGAALPFGLVLKAVSIMNKNAGVNSIFGKVQKILDMDISRDEKLVMLDKLQPEIDAASAANIKLAKHIAAVLIKGVKDGSIDQVSALHLLQAQTGIVNGFRGLSGLGLITVLDGSQKPGENHPHYKKYFKELSKTMPKDKARIEAIKLTGYKGEHLAPNSNTMFEIAELFNEKLTDAELNNRLDDIFRGHSQMHTTIGLTKTMDKELGATNDTDFNRVKALDQVDIDATVRADGTPYPIVLAEVEILKEVSKMNSAIDQRNESTEVIDKALKASRSGTKKLIDGLVDNDVADTLADAVSGVNPDGYSNVRFSRSHRAEYEQRLIKNREWVFSNPKWNKRIAKGLVDDLFKWLDSPSFYLGASSPIYAAKHKSKFEKLALHYMVHNKLILPEDGFKVIEAERLARVKKLDPFSFKNPNEIIERYSEEVDGKKVINPDDVKAFTNKRELANGITIYDVNFAENFDGAVAAERQAVRDQVNQHFGKKSNPWCIVQSADGKLTEQAEEYWDQYGTKQILFKDGKLLAMRTESREDGFSDGGNVEFWSRDNVKYNEIPGNNYVDEQGRTVMSSFDEKTGEKTGILYGATKGSIKSGKIEIYGTYTESKGHHNPNMYPYLKNGEQPQLYLEYVERYNKDGEYHGLSEEHTNPTAMKRENYESSIVTIKEYKNGKFVGSRTDRGDGQGLRPMQRVGADGILRSSDVMFSKSSTKPKGITVLDFDDTLATTKSSVLYTMPGESQWEFTADGNLYNVSKLASGKLRIVNNKTGSIVSSKSPYAKLLSYHMMIERGASEQELQKTAKRMFFGGKVPTGATLKKAQGKVSSSSKLTAEEFAKQGGDLLAEGAVFDFSEFNEVVDGKTAPLFNKAMKLAGKFGTENMFILTARAPESQLAIKQFLDAQGLKIPLKNITGLGKSEASAKANWIAEKVGEGYNDFYFADDAMQNVKAVKDMLDQFDVKGKVQQARLKFSKSGPKKMASIIDESALDLNKILEETKGVGKDKTFSAAKARQRGKNKGKFKFFVPPSADDFAGLMYSFMGRGKQGNKHHAWFKENLFDPFSKGMRRHKMVQQQVANDMKNLRKAMPDVRKKLGKKVPGTEYTHEDAIRIYNWSQAGLDIPGLSQTDATALINAVESDAKLLAFAQGVNSISNTPGGMVDPGPHWTGGNIALDLKEALDNARSTNLQQWIENKNIIFSEANMNKIEAVYGSNFREALEDSLYRMETGSTQNVGKDRLLGNFTAWIHGSIGTTMFLNARSAMLQMISNVNFVNWSDNNMLKAAGAFANQKQYWKDVSMIFNSSFLKQRRSGIQTDVNAAELLAQIKDSKNKLKAATAYLLQLGFTPTQIADSFAIATGGATFYRNRMKTYLKEGMTQAEAETKAFEDMMEIAEETQQSTRADKISQQQASPIGKFLLAFQNTPMQYNRLIKKAAQDLVNGRGDPKANISRIVYYGGIQNLIFYGLQTALFAALFSDDEEDEITAKKTERVVNGMVDTLLRGSGIGGAVVSTVKNVILKFMKESEKMDDGVYYTDPDWGNVVIEALNLSPPIGIKARKIYSGLKTWEYNKDVIDTMDKTDVDNPIYDAVASVTEAVTNVPLSRMYNKFQNISEALNSDHDTWKRVAMLLGWSKWSFGIKNQDVIDAKGEAKIIKAAEKKEGNRNTFVDDQKKEKDEGKKDITCAASTRSGGRCGNKVVGGGSHCTVHEKVKQNDTGKKTQCTHVKSDGKRCKMKTNSKSGKCYYHD